MKQIFIAIGFLIMIRVGYSQVSFDKIKDQTIYLKGGRSIKTNICELKFLGQIVIDIKPSYLIISGKPCNVSDINTSIYIQSSSEASIRISESSPHYGYPGKVNFYEDNSLLSESRAFYGEVLPGRYGIIWFQKDLTGENKWVNSVFFAEIKNGKIEENRNDELLSKTLEQVASKKAFEINGITQTSEP
jgi:hypothetical protein